MTRSFQGVCGAPKFDTDMIVLGKPSRGMIMLEILLVAAHHAEMPVPVHKWAAEVSIDAGFGQRDARSGLRRQAEKRIAAGAKGGTDLHRAAPPGQARRGRRA